MGTIEPAEVIFSPVRLARLTTAMQRYVDEKKLAGIVTLISHRNHIVHFEKFGLQDIAAGTPMELDTIFRIYSMTKPITSTALMMLYERAAFHLTDPVTKFLPDFNEIEVWTDGGKLEQPRRGITIQDLLRHTAGLSYGKFEATNHPVDKLYDEANLFDPQITLQEMVQRIASLPLRSHPGQTWYYSVATDVVGRLIEVLADKPLVEFFEENIFRPLGMTDTAFSITVEQKGRLATLYGKTDESDLAELDNSIGGDLVDVRLHAGGHGLISSATDYLRFAQCILNKGELDNERLLGCKTVELMTENHLLTALMPIQYNGVVDIPVPGIGFGLGFSILLNPALAGIMGSEGDLGWGGYADTYFWINQKEQFIAILMTQYMPSLTHPIRNDFISLVYQSLIKEIS